MLMTNPYSDEQIVEAVKKHGKFFTKDYDCMFYGIRTVDRTVDLWCDPLGVLFHLHGQLYNVWGWGTTVPGKKMLNTPINDKGALIIKPGFYQGCWQLDEQGGRREYPHFNQVGDITIVRDNDGNDTIDTDGLEETGNYFGAEYHQESGIIDSPRVGGYSAGCQVQALSVVYMATIEIARRQKSTFAGKSWADRFSYLLLDQAQIDLI